MFILLQKYAVSKSDVLAAVGGKNQYDPLKVAYNLIRDNNMMAREGICN